MAVVESGDAYKAGDQVQAIFLLGEASALDYNFYLPWERLGKIYEARGEDRLALENYRKALQKLDRSGSPDSPSTEGVLLGSIRDLQDRLGEHRLDKSQN